MPRYNRGALLGSAIARGLGGFAESAAMMRQQAATRALQEAKQGKTSAQYDYDFSKTLPAEEREGFLQLARPAPYGYTPLAGGGMRPNPTPREERQPTELEQGQAALKRVNAAKAAGREPDPIDQALANKVFPKRGRR